MNEMMIRSVCSVGSCERDDDMHSVEVESRERGEGRLSRNIRKHWQ